MRQICLFFIAVSLFAQTPNTASATVSTTRSASTGTATFQIQVLDASLNANLDAAIAIVASSGASTANLAEVSASVSQGFVVSRFDFNVTVPASEYAATRDKLIAAQRALANSSSQAKAWTVSYTVSDEALASALQQALPGLLERARAQADALAAAIGRSVDKVANLGVPVLSNSGLGVFISLTATYSLQ